MFRCIWVFVASNVHVELVEIIVTSVESTYYRIFNILASYFCQPFGENTFSKKKSTPKANTNPNILIP